MSKIRISFTLEHLAARIREENDIKHAHELWRAGNDVINNALKAGYITETTRDRERNRIDNALRGEHA